MLRARFSIVSQTSAKRKALVRVNELNATICHEKGARPERLSRVRGNEEGYPYACPSGFFQNCLTDRHRGSTSHIVFGRAQFHKATDCGTRDGLELSALVLSLTLCIQLAFNVDSLLFT